MVKLTARQIGEMNLDDFCPRCFWLKYNNPINENNPFYSPVPGVFSTLDSYVKQVVATTFSSTNNLPDWLKEHMGDKIVEIIKPKYEKTTYTVKDRNIKFELVGVPDSIWKLDNDSYAIVDYKVANYTKTQERLLPMYETQLNAYACLLESKKYTIKKLALIYFQPQKYEKYSDFVVKLNSKRLTLYFKCIVQPVKKLHSREILNLALKAVKILESSAPPKGKDDCPKCRELNNWLKGMLSNIIG